MNEEQGIGNPWSVVAAFVTATGGFFIARFGGRRDAAATAERVNVDRASHALAERQDAEIRRLMDQCAQERACAELWERRARRIDTLAHELMHVVAPLAMKGDIAPIPARLPLLEDPL